MKYLFLACLFLASCDQVDLIFFKVGEKEKDCTSKRMTIGANTGDTVTVKDSTSRCGTGQVEVKP